MGFLKSTTYFISRHVSVFRLHAPHSIENFNYLMTTFSSLHSVKETPILKLMKVKTFNTSKQKKDIQRIIIVTIIIRSR